MVGMVVTTALKSYGIVGAAMPNDFAECTSDKNITVGDKCCYIGAKALNVTVSACMLFITILISLLLKLLLKSSEITLLTHADQA